MVNRKDLVERLEELRENLPLEIKRAAHVVADRQDVLAQSREEAEAILQAARMERDELLARTEIVRAASHEADRIIEDAKVHAREIRMQAEDYVDAKLANFEIVLQKIVGTVARGRESLRGRLETAGPAGIDDTETTQRIRVRRR